MRRWLAWGWLAGCLPPAETPEGTKPDECGAWPLECPTCAFADDVADVDGIERVYRCETEDGRRLDAVTRRDPASLRDTHFYDAETGARVAAQRLYAEDGGTCREADDEWWGEVLVCTPRCEHAAHVLTDPALPMC